MKELIDSWLTPDGEIIEVGKFNHNSYARELLTIENGGRIEFNSTYPYSELHKRGWIRIKYNTEYLPKIHILGDCMDISRPMRNTMSPAMNEKQMRVALELCKKCNTTLHMAINDKRFW